MAGLIPMSPGTNPPINLHQEPDASGGRALVFEYRHSNGEKWGHLLGHVGNGIGAGQVKGDAGRHVSGALVVQCVLSSTLTRPF